MKCVGTGTLTEYEFVRSIVGRVEGCRGPLVTLPLSGYRFVALEDSLLTVSAHDLLWSGFGHPQQAVDGIPLLKRVMFTLCVAHWLDLSYLCRTHAVQHGRLDWTAEATVLLKDIYWHAGWDTKEIANLIRWQQVPFA